MCQNTRRASVDVSVEPLLQSTQQPQSYGAFKTCLHPILAAYGSCKTETVVGKATENSHTERNTTVSVSAFWAICSEYQQRNLLLIDFKKGSKQPLILTVPKGKKSKRAETPTFTDLVDMYENRKRGAVRTHLAWELTPAQTHVFCLALWLFLQQCQSFKGPQSMNTYM